MTERLQRPWIWPRDQRPPAGTYIECTHARRFGNPFPVIDGDHQAAVDAYRAWVLDPNAQPEIRLTPSGRRQTYWPPTAADLDFLAGIKFLVCYCDPGKPCHVDVILELLADRLPHLRGEY